MPMLRRAALPLIGIAIGLTTPWPRAATAVAATPAAFRLTRWEEPALLFSHHAPGAEYYRLIARARREGDAPLPGKYQVRVVLPDGQVGTQDLSDQDVSARRLPVLVRASAVRNLRPDRVVVRAVVVDAATGSPVSNELTATIDDFPHPAPEASTNDVGPFGWGEPLSGRPDQARALPRPGPDGFSFIRVPAGDDAPGFFLATTEATNAQVGRRLQGYDAKAGRSDEFALEDPAQPAIGLSPKRARDYLAGLGTADPSGVTYRLPTRAEWLRAARTGLSTTFWWGDEPTHPAGANLLGPEPALAVDATAPSQPAQITDGFEPNPWSLFHTYGNVAEWATSPSGGFVRLGGHFRTEPASPLPEVPVEDEDATGPDPYVGVRPAFDLTAESGAELIRKALHGNALLADVGVTFDPDRVTATLTGELPDPSLRRAADRRLEPLWFLAAVENRITTPNRAPGQLATLGGVAGPVRRITPLGRWVYEVPVSVLWADPLPVSGSEYYVNVYPPRGAPFAHKLVEIAPNDARKITVLIERSKMAAAGLPVDAPVPVALSLGAEAPTPTDPHVISNVLTLRWKAL